MKESLQILGFGLAWLLAVMVGNIIGCLLYWYVLKPAFLWSII